MTKKNITIFFVLGIVVLVISGVLFGVETASAANNGSTSLNALAYVGIIGYVLGSILSLISWIGALVATARLSRWGWFVAIFLLGGLGELIYLIAGPSIQASQV